MHGAECMEPPPLKSSVGKKIQRAGAGGEEIGGTEIRSRSQGRNRKTETESEAETEHPRSIQCDTPRVLLYVSQLPATIQSRIPWRGREAEAEQQKRFATCRRQA